MNRLASLVAVAIAGSAIVTLPALAAGSIVSDDQTMDVTLTVDPSCTVDVTDLSFGTITSLAADATESTAGNIAVTCTDNANYEIGLGAGLHAADAGATTRSLLNGNAAADNLNLDYELYSENTHTTVWGDDEASDTVSGTGTGSPQNHSVYGKVTSGQALSVGTYGDTVAVTVWYEGEGSV